jgi:hypothetical protein
MESDYSRRQSPDNWPPRKPWSPEGLPDWYLDLLGDVARNLTAWREHDPPQRLDPRCDPRGSARNHSSKVNR